MSNLVPKLESQFKSIGLTLKKDENTFKSTYNVMRDLSAIFGNLSQMKQIQLLELLGGKRNATTVAAILQNFDNVEKSLTASLNSMGSSAKENALYLDSITGKVAIFQSNIQRLWTNTINSSTIKNLVDFSTSLVSVADSIGLGNVALIGLITYLGIFNKTIRANTIGALVNFIAKMQMGVVAANAAKVSVMGLNVSVGALTTTLTLGLAVAIPTIIKGIQHLSSASDRYIESLEKQNTELQENINKHQEFINTSQQVATEYNQLANKTNLNNNEIEALKKLQDQILKNYPDIIELVDEEGKIHLKTADAIRTANKERTKQQASDLADMLENDIKKAEVKIKNFQKKYGGYLLNMGTGTSNPRLNKLMLGVLDDLNEEHQNIFKTIAQSSTEISTLTGEVTEGTANQLDFLSSKFIELYSDMDNQSIDDFKNKWDELTKSINSEDFKKAQKDYNELVESYIKGEIPLAKVEGAYSNLKTTFSENTGLMGDLISKFVQIPEDINLATNSISEYVSEADKLTASVDSTQKSLSTLGSAFDTLSKNEDLSLDTMQELITNYPLLAEHMAETGDATFNNGELIKTLFEIKKQTYIKELEIEQVKTKGVIDGINARIEARRQEMGGMMSLAEVAGRYSKLMAEAGLDVEAMNRYDSLIAQIKVLKNVTLDTFKSSTKTSKSSTSATKNQTSEFMKQFTVLKELYGAGYVTAEDYHTKLENLNDKHFSDLQGISAEKLKNNLLDEKTADRTEEYINLVKELSTETKKLSDEEDKRADKRKKQIDDAIKGSQKAELDQFRDKIDLLKDIQKAKMDMVDDDLDALERQYDAQTKANEASERALELAKAQERLANIKKNENVRILQGDKFVWIADPREIKKAQDDINNLLKADREAKRKDEYESQKKLLEDKKAAIKEDYDDRIQEAENFYNKWEPILNGEIEKLEDYKSVLASLTDAEKEQYADRLSELKKFVNERNALTNSLDARKQTIEKVKDTGMSKSDLNKIEQLRKDWDKYNASGDTLRRGLAHLEVEKIRKKYGYSGGADGSEYISVNHEGLNAGFVGNVPFDPKHEKIVKALKGEVYLNKFDLNNIIPNTLKSVFSNFKMPNFTPMQPAMAGSNGMNFHGDINIKADNPTQMGNALNRYRQVNK